MNKKEFNKRNYVPKTMISICLLLANIVHTTVSVSVSDKEAQITKYRFAPADERGVFKFAFATSNGIEVQGAGSPIESIGIFSYVSPEGIPIELRYIADELGFHAVGRHLPRPQPIPDYILRSIEYIKQHAQPTATTTTTQTNKR